MAKCKPGPFQGLSGPTDTAAVEQTETHEGSIFKQRPPSCLLASSSNHRVAVVTPLTEDRESGDTADPGAENEQNQDR